VHLTPLFLCALSIFRDGYFLLIEVGYQMVFVNGPFAEATDWAIFIDLLTNCGRLKADAFRV
jgi:hypothetical protein